MKKRYKAKQDYNKLFLLYIFAATIFMGIGYAAITSITMDVKGDTVALAQDSLYITGVTKTNDVNADLEGSKILSVKQTILNSKIVLSPTDKNSSIEYTITVYNKTAYDYIFTGITYSEEFYDNNNIICEISELSQLNVQDIISGGNSSSFIVTFKYKDDVDITVEDFNNVLNSYINFNFEYKITPRLTSKMIPIDYDSGQWKKTDAASSDWHEYYSGKWANALTYNNNLAYNEVEPTIEGKKFNGSSDVVALGGANTDPGQKITMVARFKLSSIEERPYLILGNPQDGGIHILKNTGNKLGFYLYDSSISDYQRIYSTFTVETDTWYTMAATYDGKNIALYINGIFQESTTVGKGVTKSKAQYAVGANSNTDGSFSKNEYFHGVMSDAIILTEALTEEQIIENYSDIVNHQPDKYATLYNLKFDGDNGNVYNSASYENEGMVFDGVDDYINIGYTLYEFNSKFTVGARVKFGAHSNSEMGIIGNPQSSGFFLLKDETNKISFYVYDKDAKEYTMVKTSSALEIDKWYNIVATCDGSYLRLYIDGVQAAYKKDSLPMKTSNVPIMIGANPTIHSEIAGLFKGTISDVILIDEVLTADQISANYSSDLRTIISDKTMISYNLRAFEGRENGTVVPDEMVNAMWTWIPRFSTSTPSENGAIDIKIVGPNGKAHDAFNFAGEELEGFWIGKFENSSKNSSSNILIKPNNISLRNKNINDTFNSIKNIQTLSDVYGIKIGDANLIDTHLIKNSEWGAVAYLAQSKYGLCTEGICKTIENNNSDYITGGLNYMSNVGQSTTGNVYGVYDLSGGAEEFTMANYNNTLNSLDGFTILPEAKYLNIYTTPEDYLLKEYQHATVETNNIFNNTSSSFVSLDNNWLTRTSLFGYNATNGTAQSNIGSRSVMIIK